MKNTTRNLLVGFTVMTALGLLGGMIMIFREVPSFMRVGYYEVRAVLPTSGGLVSGADVMMAGKRIGRVASVDFVDGDPRKGVVMTLVIKSEYSIPGNANPYIEGKGFTGGALLVLGFNDGRDPGTSRKDPKTGKPLEWIPRDPVMTLHAPEATGGGGPSLIPRELVDSITKTMGKFDVALDSINKVIGDEQSQANIKAALAGFKTASDGMNQAMGDMTEAMNEMKALSGSAKTAVGRYDELARKLIDDADKLGKLLTTLNNAAEKIDSGEGTAGKLLNDPRLYNELADTAVQFKATLTTLDELLTQWKAGGVSINVK